AGARPGGRRGPRRDGGAGGPPAAGPPARIRSGPAPSRPGRRRGQPRPGLRRGGGPGGPHPVGPQPLRRGRGPRPAARRLRSDRRCTAGGPLAGRGRQAVPVRARCRGAAAHPAAGCRTAPSRAADREAAGECDNDVMIRAYAPLVGRTFAGAWPLRDAVAVFAPGPQERALTGEDLEIAEYRAMSAAAASIIDEALAVGSPRAVLAV